MRMNKKELSYWEKRKNQRIFEYMEEAEKTAEQIADIYVKASRYLTYKAEDIFEKYADKHELTEKEAIVLLSRMKDKEDIEELKRLLETEKDDKKKKNLLARLEAPAYQFRISRLKQLQDEIDLMMKSVYEQEKLIATDFYTNVGIEAYYKSIFDIQKNMGMEFQFAGVNGNQIEKALNEKWSGENYSSRIWNNTDALAKDIKEQLTVSLMTGKPLRDVVKEIENRFLVGNYQARRLVRTESAYIVGQLELESYKECGIQEYIFVATLDLRTSVICRNMDKMRIKIEDALVGRNYPPMHPFCRSTTIAYISEEILKTMKARARDPETGENIFIPANMTWNEWYNKYVSDKMVAKTIEKKVKGESADKKQYKSYKEVLGNQKDLESFAKFQDMKYNKNETWQEIKEAYKDVNWQKKCQGNISSGEVHKVPFENAPNSVFDKYENGKIIQRRYYGKTGKPRLDIDLTDHGNAVKHPVVPHRHGWKELNDSSVKRDEVHDMSLRLGDKIANADILQKG